MAVWRYTSVALVAFTGLFGAAVSPASANMCDLTTVNSSCGPNTNNGGWSTGGGNSIAQGGIFQQISPQPTGTGFIDSFVRIQHSPTEQGYNTDGRPVQFDEKTDATFTHSLNISHVPVVNVNGTNYRQFFLDINENNSTNGRYLSLDRLQIFLEGAGNLTNYVGGANPTLGGKTAIYNLDTGGVNNDNWIKLDYSLNSGSGSGDMVAYIPDYLFTNNATNGAYVYLYSQFGATLAGPTNITSDAGFEEWWTNSPIAVTQTPVPEPTGLLLLGSGLVMAGKRLRLRRNGRGVGDGQESATKVAADTDLSPAVS